MMVTSNALLTADQVDLDLKFWTVHNITTVGWHWLLYCASK